MTQRTMDPARIREANERYYRLRQRPDPSAPEAAREVLLREARERPVGLTPEQMARRAERVLAEYDRIVEAQREEDAERARVAAADVEIEFGDGGVSPGVVGPARRRDE